MKKLKTFKKLIFSLRRIIAESASVSKGIGLINTPARPASIVCSALDIRKNGMAEPSDPIAI